MTRRAWLLPAVVILTSSCRRTADDAATAFVGTWKIVRENGKPAKLPAGHSGIVRHHADGTITPVTATGSDGPAQATYRFLDAETLEVTEAGGKQKKVTYRAVVSGDLLTLHDPERPDRTAELERVK